MPVSVVLFPNLNTPTSAPLSELTSQLPTIPQGFQLTGGKRKFVILKKDDDLVVVIGPELAGRSYYHRDIFDIAKKQFHDHIISGGGSVEFSFGWGGWSVKFFDRSGDFGVYDPLILIKDSRKAIQQAIGLPVFFSWES